MVGLSLKPLIFRSNSPTLTHQTTPLDMFGGGALYDRLDLFFKTLLKRTRTSRIFYRKGKKEDQSQVSGWRKFENRLR